MNIKFVEGKSSVPDAAEAAENTETIVEGFEPDETAMMEAEWEDVD